MDYTEPEILIECNGAESSFGTTIDAVRFGGTVNVVDVRKNETAFPFMRILARNVEVRF